MRSISKIQKFKNKNKTVNSMTKLLYLKDSYLKEFEAVVTQVLDDKNIILDQTVFYPESGGQLYDTGSLTRLADSKVFNVLNVRKKKDIVHEIDQPGLKEGDKVIGKLDWERRYTLMQAHTAAHVLSAVFHQEAKALITGNQLGLNKSRIDFNLENFDREKIDSYFNKANSIIAKDLNVTVEHVSRDKAEQNPSLFKLAKKLPSSIKTLRIVEIENFDRQADAGTHVKRLGEIKRIKFLKAENKGKNNRRIYFELG